LGRSLVIETTSGNKLGICVIGLARDVNSPEPFAPEETSLKDGTPQVSGTAAVLLAVSYTNTPKFYGYVELFLLERDHWLGDGAGSRIRYRLSGLVPKNNYVLVVNRYHGGKGGIFVGWNVTRKQVGAWEHNVSADENGHAHNEFIDHHTKFNDYNSILGRSIVMSHNGNIIAHGVIGTMEQHNTLDYPGAPITKAKVSFTTVNQLDATHGWLTTTHQGKVNYELNNLQANRSYGIYVYSSGDLFSIGDANVDNLLSAGEMSYAIAETLKMSSNGNRIGNFTEAKIKLNGKLSVLGNVVAIRDLITQKAVAAGVLGIEQDDPAYTGPKEIHCDIECPDAPTESPTPVIVPPASMPTESFYSKALSASYNWGTLVVVVHTMFVGLLYLDRSTIEMI